MSTFEIIIYSAIAALLYFSPVILLFYWFQRYDSASASWDYAYKNWSIALSDGDEESVTYWKSQMTLAESKMNKLGG